jgi:6-phosphofructokinase 1
MMIGILTSGGDAPGMNAIVAGACDEVERLGGRALGIHGGFAGLAGRRASPITARQAHDHVQEAGTWLGTSRWPQLREPEGRAACRDAIESLAITGLLVIGGDGSAKGARALADTVPVAVVPATIDRDLEGTELTIGLDSAIAYATDTIDRLRVTGRSLPGRAFLLQTLGAPSGFLADAVAAAAGIDDVLVPERPFDLDDLGRRLRERSADGPAIAVMSEAVGDAVRVAEALAARSGLRVHPTILGHAQRAATPSALDRALGEAAGRAAVSALAASESTFVGLTHAGTVAPAPLLPPAAAASFNRGEASALEESAKHTADERQVTSSHGESSDRNWGGTCTRWNRHRAPRL